MNQKTETTGGAKMTSHDRSKAFISYVSNLCARDNGAKASLKRADNPSTEHQCWDILAGFNVNLEDENKRLPYATIASAIARSDLKTSGQVSFGKALASCYEDASSNGSARAKLRRLLACDSTPEVCRILRPLFSLIESRSKCQIDYSSLLSDLLWFGHDESRQKIKARWAQSFYAASFNGGDDE